MFYYSLKTAFNRTSLTLFISCQMLQYQHDGDIQLTHSQQNHHNTDQCSSSALYYVTQLCAVTCTTRIISSYRWTKVCWYRFLCFFS